MGDYFSIADLEKFEDKYVIACRPNALICKVDNPSISGRSEQGYGAKLKHISAELLGVSRDCAINVRFGYPGPTGHFARHVDFLRTRLRQTDQRGDERNSKHFYPLAFESQSNG